MKLKLLAAVGTAALMATPTLVSATDHWGDQEGWYVRGQAGYGQHTDIDITGDLVGDVESEGNGTASVGVGYDFGEHWRLELDGASLWTDLGSIAQVTESYAKLRTNTLMINALYDFDDFGRWEPYVGAGVGLVHGHGSAEAHHYFNPMGTAFTSTACATDTFPLNQCRAKDQGASFGWQLLAGLGYSITEKLTWDTQYRYLGASDFDLDSTLNGASGNTTFEDAGAHSLMTGLRYRFGKKAEKPMVSCWDGSMEEMYADCPARPAPEPVRTQVCWNGSEIPVTSSCPVEPAPVQYKTCWDGTSVEVSQTCPAQPVRQTYTCRDGSIVYDSINNCPVANTTVVELCGNQYRQEIIYYEFDKGASAETRNTISRILDAGAYCKVDNIRVVGHTDTSGAASYNLALSQQRAKDARQELVRQGINPILITAEGKGETEPFVQTGDGVKEQLNRRTEVIIQLSETGAINY